jgi:hypothetical protein
LQVQGADPDFSTAFQAAITQKIAALITIGTPVLNGHPKKLPT